MANDEEIEEKLFNLRKFRRFDNIEPVPYHFRDGKRRIHYIIVLHDAAIYKSDILRKVLNFLNFLEEQGLEFEFDIGLMDSNLVYLKVHATDEVIKHLAELYEVDIENAGHNFIPDDSRKCYFRTIEITRDNGDVFRRAGTPTSCEIIQLLYKILSDPLTDDDKQVYGIEKLIKMGYIKDAFPLHDGRFEWTEDYQENLNDRQLLSKYWARYSLWCKEQPLNLIEKYFSTEHAFYFAWYEYYNLLLIWAALIGIIFVSVNVFILLVFPPEFIDVVCDSDDVWMCPMCAEEICKFVKLSNYCVAVKAEFVLGNYINVLYAIFISIWVTAFLVFWKRKENTLRVRWNVYHSVGEYKIRPEYKDKCIYMKKSVITGKLEPYIPLGMKIARYGFTYVTIFLVVILVSSYVILLIMLKNIMMTLVNNESSPVPTIVAAIFYSILQVIFIKILSLFYIRISVCLTKMEVPKTQIQYDYSVIYKIYLFGFINNYIPILYTAFLRNRFFTTPGQRSFTGIFEQDFCLPTGCILPLDIQLFVVMALKNFGSNIFAAIGRCIRRNLFAASQSKTVSDTKMYVPNWEKEYHSQKVSKETCAFEFSEMILQFGYVSFFIAAFPLVGVIALINNFVQLRMDAIKLVNGCRRPVPFTKSGIGAWNDIIKFASYFSIICNAFLVAFNTNFIQGMIYRQTRDSFTAEGFLNFFFSRYAISDLPADKQNVKSNSTECYYTGFRHPPTHPRRYQESDEHYLIYAWKFIFVIIFENAIFFIIIAIYYYVSDMPRRVREQLHKDRLSIKQAKMRILDEKMRTMSNILRRRQSSK